MRVTAGFPPTPFTVKLYVPLETPDRTVTVRLEEDVAGFGEKVPLAPLGSPLIDKVTGELNPFAGATVTV